MVRGVECLKEELAYWRTCEDSFGIAAKEAAAVRKLLAAVDQSTDASGGRRPLRRRDFELPLSAADRVAARTVGMEIQREGLEGLRRRNFDRACCKFFDVGIGGAHGSKAALNALGALTLRCSRRGCKALVDYGCAHRAAVKRGKPSIYVVGDGCAGEGCAARFRRARFDKQQAKYRKALRRRLRVLIEWPANTGDTNFKVLNGESTSFVKLGKRRGCNE